MSLQSTPMGWADLHLRAGAGQGQGQGQGQGRTGAGAGKGAGAEGGAGAGQGLPQSFWWKCNALSVFAALQHSHV